MQAYWTLTRRELASFFCSITGYVIISGLALLVGFDIVALLKSQGTQPFAMPVTQLFFNNLLLWIVIVLTTPIITMRLFALEKATGTFETLMTTPVSDVQVVAAKFSAAVVFFVVMWLPSLACLFIVQHFVNQPGALDQGTLLSMYLGVVLAGCLLLSIGCLASAMTRSQVLAAMVTLVAGLGRSICAASSKRCTFPASRATPPSASAWRWRAKPAAVCRRCWRSPTARSTAPRPTGAIASPRRRWLWLIPTPATPRAGGQNQALRSQRPRPARAQLNSERFALLSEAVAICGGPVLTLAPLAIDRVVAFTESIVRATINYKFGF